MIKPSHDRSDFRNVAGDLNARVKAFTIANSFPMVSFTTVANFTMIYHEKVFNHGITSTMRVLFTMVKVMFFGKTPPCHGSVA